MSDESFDVRPLKDALRTASVHPRLTGRDTEMARLREAASPREDREQLLVITGASGIGKSALAASLLAEMRANGARTAHGKFAQFLSTTAFAAPLQALTELCGTLLTEPEERLAPWRRSLVEAIGANLGLLTGLVPNLGVLLDLPAATTTGGEAGAQQTDRLKRALVDAFATIATFNESLVVWIDDMQWTDGPTLSWLSGLVEGTMPSLRIVLTSRTAGLEDGELFGQWLGKAESQGLRSLHLELQPLSEPGVAALVSELLGQEPSNLSAAVRRIHLAAAGNPLHVIEAVRALQGAGVPGPTVVATGRDVDGSDSDLAAESGDLRTLIQRRLSALDEVQRRLLVIAACVGGSVDLRMLAAVSGIEQRTAGDAARRAVAAGLLESVPPAMQSAGSGICLRIAHDQIEAAARSLVGDAAWRQTHLSIAQELARTGRDDMQAGLHLAEAIELLTQVMQRLEGMRLLVRAAEDARRSANFDITLQLLALARSLRTADAWEARPDETFALEAAWHRALSTLARHDECELVYQQLCSRSVDGIDLVSATLIQMAIVQSRCKVDETIALGMDLLHRIAPDLPFHRLGTDLAEEWAWLRRFVSERPLESLGDGPAADRRTSATARLLNRIADASIGDPSMTAPWCSLALMRLWADCGFHESMIPATLQLGLRGLEPVDPALAQRLASFGMDVARHRASPEMLGYMELGYSMTVLPWSRPLEEAVDVAMTCFTRLGQVGDFEMAAYSTQWGSSATTEFAENLQQAEQSAGSSLRFAERMNQPGVIAGLSGLLIFIGRLRGRSGSSETASTGYPPIDVNVFAYLALCSLILGEGAELARLAAILDPLIALTQPIYQSALASFVVCWSSIERLTSGEVLSPSKRVQLDAGLATLRENARWAPANFAVMRDLLEARLAAVESRHDDAATLFDAAARSAVSVSRPWQHALTIEHTGRFYRNARLASLGERLLREAHERYLSWGATRKAEALVREFPFLESTSGHEPPQAAPSLLSPDLDRIALYRASQALSSETDMTRLVERIFSIVTRLTGATGAWLLRRIDRNWQPVGQTHSGERLPETLLRYASRMLRTEAIEDLSTDPRFAADPGTGRGPFAVLIVPITDKGVAHAVLLLQNSNEAAFFTSAHIDTVETIAGQLSISLRNAELYQTLELRVAQRTEELQRTATALALRDRALESSSSGVHISELTPGGKVVVYVNRMFEAITGYTGHDLRGSPIWVLFGPESEQPGAQALRAAVDARRPASATVRCYRRDGSVFWNELSISPFQTARGDVYFVGVHMDVSERVRAAEDEKRRTDRLRAVFELSPDGFVVLDSSATISIVNPAFCRMTGLVADDLLGRRLSEFERALQAVSSPSGELVDRGAFANVLAGEPQTDIDAGMGENGWLLTVAGPQPRTLVRRVRHAHDGTETVIYFCDVTRELEVDRMKSEFLSVAAHELRTPMTSIYGFSELLVTGRMPADQQAGIHRIIHKQSTALIGLVGQLLDLARINALQGANIVLRPTSLQSVARDVIGALRGIESSERIVDAMPADDVMAMIDADQFHLAITNVLSNALKYSTAGSIDVEIATREAPRGRSQAGLRVRDHGIGMTPEQLSRLFERFYRANPTSDVAGTGLGSNIVRDIMTAHKGEIEVSSELGVGTVVTLWLDRLAV